MKQTYQASNRTQLREGRSVRHGLWYQHACNGDPGEEIAGKPRQVPSLARVFCWIDRIDAHKEKEYWGIHAVPGT